MPKYSVLRMARGLKDAFRPVVVTPIDEDYHAFIVRYKGDYITHAHDKDEFVTILEGAVTFEIGGGEQEVRQGESILIPAGSPHRPRCGNMALGLVVERRGLQRQMEEDF